MGADGNLDRLMSSFLKHRPGLRITTKGIAVCVTVEVLSSQRTSCVAQDHFRPIPQGKFWKEPQGLLRKTRAAGATRLVYERAERTTPAATACKVVDQNPGCHLDLRACAADLDRL